MFENSLAQTRMRLLFEQNYGVLELGCDAIGDVFAMASPGNLHALTFMQPLHGFSLCNPFM